MPLSRNSNKWITIRLEQFGFSSYREYLGSCHWRETKAAFYGSGRFKGRCYSCGDKVGPFEVHHRTYKRLCCERIGDLLALCSSCHTGAHKLLNSGQADIYTCAKLFRKERNKAKQRVLKSLVTEQSSPV